MNRIIDSIGYTGQVIVSLAAGKGKPINKFKNMGMQPLFDLITRFLAGYDVKRKIPAYLDIVDGTSSLLRQPVSLTGVVWGDFARVSGPNSSSLKMTAVVTLSDKRDLVVGSKEILFRIINIDGEVLAQIQGQDLSKLYDQVQVGVDMLIEWILTFGNSST